MTRLRHGLRAGAVVMALWMMAGWGAAAQPVETAPQAQAPTAAQDEFVPIDQLPPEDRLPAAPFLIAAYTVTLVLLAGYVWLLWRRLATVQRELEVVRRAGRPGGAPM